jgi:putative FmdB family regulatory protein
MPIYEYTCHDCRDEFELLLRGSETPHCPKCGSRRLAKQFSVPAAHTSGSSRSLPVCEPSSVEGTCGRPQCGMGGCQML